MPLIQDISLVQRIGDNHWVYRMTYNNDQIVDAKGGWNISDARRGAAKYLRGYVKTIEGIGVSFNSPVFDHIQSIRQFVKGLDTELEKELFSLDKASKLVLSCQHSIN